MYITCLMGVFLLSDSDSKIVVKSAKRILITYLLSHSVDYIAVHYIYAVFVCNFFCHL